MTADEYVTVHAGDDMHLFDNKAAIRAVLARV